MRVTTKSNFPQRVSKPKWLEKSNNIWPPWISFKMLTFHNILLKKKLSGIIINLWYFYSRTYTSHWSIGGQQYQLLLSVVALEVLRHRRRTKHILNPIFRVVNENTCHWWNMWKHHTIVGNIGVLFPQKRRPQDRLGSNHILLYGISHTLIYLAIC